MNELFVPALRGVFGDWVYYSCLLPIQDVARRVDYAKTLHKNKNLSDLIQREIKRGRGPKIAEYIKNEKERFFNSLVVAVYDGRPTWHEIGVQSNNEEIDIEELPSYAVHSFGILKLSGSEKLFAVDGQHRLAGIKQAIADGADYDDEVSVIMIAHKNTSVGLKRTRRLFTTLNKTAVAVSKGEKIALDENDAMALVARRLVDDNNKFNNNRIAYKATNNIGAGDDSSLTTIGNLYDVLKVLFTKICDDKKVEELQYWSPEEKSLERYYQCACKYFLQLEKAIPELQEFFDSDAPEDIIEKYRGEHGGHLIYRPIGLMILTEVIAELYKTYEFKVCLEMVSNLPLYLDQKPLAGVVWDVKGRRVIPKGRVLAKDLLLYMLGQLNERKMSAIKKRYADALGTEVDNCSLPEQLYEK